MPTCYDPSMDAEELARVARRYQRAQDAAEAARAELTEATKAAFAGGMRKAEILRAIDHVWSREWLDQVLGRTPR